MEVLKQQSRIFIPENKQSAWIYRQGTKITKDSKKEHQGLWAVSHNVTLLKPSPIEVWVFFKDKVGNIDCPDEVRKDNPLQGKFAYDPSLEHRRKATPDQMWFYPPKTKVPKGIKVAGIWIKPEYKRDLSGLNGQKMGFMNITGKTPIHKGGLDP